MPPLEHLPSSLSCAFHCDLSHHLGAVQQELEQAPELKSGLHLWPRKSSDPKLFTLLLLLLEMFASPGNFPFTALTSNAPAWHKAISRYLVAKLWLQQPRVGSAVGSGRMVCAPMQ